VRTQMLGQVQIDQERLREELELSRGFSYAEQYPEFQNGRPWQTCMLWSTGGDVGDGVIAHYDTSLPATPTVFGEQLPYLRQVVEETFKVEHLLFARMVVMSDNVLVPHRDFLEFTENPATARAKHRLHIPLSTSEDCLFMEDDTVYRMPFGGVWSLDVSRMHSAAVLSDFRRVHLILDFADVPDGSMLRQPQPQPVQGIPADCVIDRPPLSDRERDAVRNLCGLVESVNLRDVFGLVIRKHYLKDGGANFAWDAIEEIARLSGDPDVAGRIDKLYKHTMLDRDE
jgi:hypothetical protein